MRPGECGDEDPGPQSDVLLYSLISYTGGRCGWTYYNNKNTCNLICKLYTFLYYGNSKVLALPLFSYGVKWHLYRLKYIKVIYNLF